MNGNCYLSVSSSVWPEQAGRSQSFAPPAPHQVASCILLNGGGGGRMPLCIPDLLLLLDDFQLGEPFPVVLDLWRNIYLPDRRQQQMRRRSDSRIVVNEFITLSTTHGGARIVPCSRPSPPSRLRSSPCASSRAFWPPNARRATSVSSCPWCLQPHRLALLAHRDLACGAIRSKAFLLLGITRKAETSQTPTPPTSSAT